MADIATLGIRVDADGAIRQLNDLSKGADKATKSTDALEWSVSKLGKLFGVYQALRAAQDTIRLADSYQILRARLALVTDGTTQLNRVQEQLFQSAQKSRTGFEATAELYSRIARNAKDLHLQETDLLKVTDTINKAMVVSGTSAESASAALVQLGQAFASNRLGGDELRSVLEQAPRLAQAIANGMNVSIGKLRELGAEGKLTGKAVADALLSQSNAIDREFSKVPKTVSGAMQQVKNSLLDYVGKANESSGATLSLSANLTVLAENMAVIIGLGTKLAVLFGISFAAKYVTQAIEYGKSVAIARAETQAYAFDAERTALAVANEAKAEAQATQVRIRQTEVTVAAAEAEVFLQAQLVKTANLRVASNGLGGDLTSTKRGLDNLVAVNDATKKLEVSKIALTATEAELAAVQRVAAAAQAEQVAATTAATVANKAYTATTGVLTAITAGATTVVKALWAAMGGWVGAGILAVVGIYKLISNSVAETKKHQDDLNTAFAKAHEGLDKSQLEAKWRAIHGQIEETKKALASLPTPSAPGSSKFDDSGQNVQRQRAITLQKELNELYQQQETLIPILNAAKERITQTTTDETKKLTEQEKALLALKTANDERVLTARQNVELAGKESAAAAELAISFKAVNDVLKGRAAIEADNDLSAADKKTEIANLQKAVALEKQLSIEALKVASARQTANDSEDRLRVAQQELELAKKVGTEQQVQAANNKALNDSVLATRNARKEDLGAILDSIEAERRLTVETIKTAAAKRLGEENSDRLRIAAQALQMAKLEGLALTEQQIQNAYINQEKEARRALDDDEYKARVDVLKTERDNALAIARGNDLLEQRKAKQDELNRKAKEYLAEGKRLIEGFQKQFSSTLSGGIADILDKGLTSFSDFTKSVKDLFLKMFADIIAAQATKKLAGALGSLVPGSQYNLKNAGNANYGQGTTGLGALGAGVVGFGAGYGVGSQTSNKTAGALGGALSGAAAGASLGSIIPGLGTAVGAVIGAVAGLVGGLLGSSKKGKEAAKAMQQSQATLDTALDGIRKSLSNDQLGAALEASRAQFDQLRQAAIAAYGRYKDDSGLKKRLAEIADLENQRALAIANEYAIAQQALQGELKVRELRAKGQDAEADALVFQQAQLKERQELEKSGASAATLAAAAVTQQAEAAKFLADQAKAAAQKLEDARRTVFDLTNAAQAFSDPRGAAKAQLAEEQSRRIFDAIAKGAGEAELAAIALFNAAEKANREAEQVEADRRVRESLIARALTASGDARGAEDVSIFAGQRQEMIDAIKAGMSETNIALLKFTQFAEREALATKRAIEDGTKAINERAKNEIAAVDLLIDVTRTAANAQLKKLDEQISALETEASNNAKAYDVQISTIRDNAKRESERIDAQIAAAREGVGIAKSQLSALEKTVQTNQKVVDALTSFSDSVKLGDLSTFSPEDKLAEAQRQFDALTTRARGGDADAAAQLPNAANALLTASQNFNARNEGFVADFNKVNNVIAEITAQFGKTLPIDQQTLEAMRAQVDASEQFIDALGRQKDVLQKNAEQEIDILTKAKDEAAEAYKKLLEKLQEQRDKISADAEATITKLQETKQAIIDAAQKQIDQLIADENAKLANRIKENEFYDTFKEYAANATKFFDSFPASGETDIPGAPPRTRNPALPSVAAGPVTTPAEQEQIDAAKQTNKVLNDKLQKVTDQLERLINTLVGSSTDEVDATRDISEQLKKLTSEVRTGNQAATVRKPSVGIGA